MTKKNKRKRTSERDPVFHLRFREDIKYWVQTDRSVALRTFDLVEAIMRDPFTGIGIRRTWRFADSSEIILTSKKGNST